jgi:cell division septation protein DedD
VSPERDEPTDEQELELYEDVPPRSIFAATWFRVVLVVIVLGVVGAVTVPYVLDWMNPLPAPRSTAATKPPLAVEPPSATSSVADKRDSTVLPAPATSSLAPAPSRPEAKGEPKSSTRPAAESATSGKSTLPEKKTSTTEARSAMAVTESPAKPRAAKPAAAKQEVATKSDAGRGDATPSTAAKPAAARQVAAKSATPAAADGGQYWVQVGAFKDPEAAKRVASKLRDENFKVDESPRRSDGAPGADTRAPAAAPGSERYDVFVSGMSAEDLNRRLAGKGLTGAAAASGGGLVVQPSLPLRDAVALSKDLAVDGFKVQVRRAGADATVAAAAGPAAGDRALHRVRVGAFADKGAAQAAARELEAKGYRPFIARGDQ